ncbi:MAG: HAD family hydrolase [Chloroflexota bacterium]|nr:HAD family hydrolase [Chloroflexota bacterium]
MLRAILFDLDNTILDRRSSLANHLRQQQRRLPDTFAAISFDDYVDTFMELDHNGYTARAEVFHGVERILRLPAGTASALLQDLQAHFPDECVAFPNVHEVLGTLAGSGLGLGLITNGAAMWQQRKIDSLGIAKYFGVILISEAEGLRKPDPEIFRRAVDTLGVSAEEVVMVGDNPEADIRGAKSFGMKAVWKHDDYWDPPEIVDGVIDNLEELPQVLQDLS